MKQPKRTRLGIGVALALGLSGLAVAQDPLKELKEKFKRDAEWMEGLKGRTDQEFARQAEAMRAGLGELKKLQHLSEALVQESAGDFRAAVKERKADFQKVSRTPLAQLSAKDRELYRWNLLELARLGALMGEYEETSKWVTVWRKDLSQLYGPADLAPRICDLIRAGTFLLLSEKPLYAIGLIHEARTLCAKLPPELARTDGKLLLAYCRLAEAQVANAAGAYFAARGAAEEALKLLRQQFAGEPLEIAAALEALASAQVNLGETGDAFSNLQRVLTICNRSLVSKAHPARAMASMNLAALYFERGEEPAALDQVGMALKEFDKLFPPAEEKFPKSHPRLIRAKVMLGDMLSLYGQHKKALELLEKACKNCAAFYPRAHSERVAALLSYGRSLRADGQQEEAWTQFQAAEKLARELQPRNPDALALCLLQCGSMHAQRGEHPAALRDFEEARTIYQRLDARGHPHLSALLQQLGLLRLQLGQRKEAAEAFAEALRRDQEAVSHFARNAAAAEALVFAQPRRLSLHGYLAITRDGGADPGEVYAHVWAAKSSVTRQLEERRAALRLALAQKSDAVAEPWSRLIEIRRQIGHLLLTAGEETDARQVHLPRLLDEAEGLERQLIAQVPEFQRQVAVARSTPADLARALPAGSVFVDFIRYDDFLSPGTVVPHYVAFVLAPGGKPIRVELGAAAAIDQDVSKWRNAVRSWNRFLSSRTRQQQEEASAKYAKALRDKVWQRIAPHLPAGTNVIHLALDGAGRPGGRRPRDPDPGLGATPTVPPDDLTRFPFAVLPGAEEGTFLLETFRFDTVPHGPFLLNRLLHAAPRRDGADRLLVVGAVDEDTSKHPVGREAVQLAGHWAKSHDVLLLRGGAASSTAVCAELRTARSAYIATHARFEQEKLTKEHQQVEQRLREWNLHLDLPARGVGLGRRSPLSYTRLLLAGPDGGILRGDTIAELPLDNLYLVVLAACMTGLGEDTAGEGVQGLHWAFHLAGCPNILSSLWDVPDDATHVLMEEFYRQLWDEGKSPPEALRQAQIACLRHPERLPGGNPDAKPGTSRAPVQLWAGFVHFGIGQ